MINRLVSNNAHKVHTDLKENANHVMLHAHNVPMETSVHARLVLKDSYIQTETLAVLIAHKDNSLLMELASSVMINVLIVPTLTLVLVVSQD